MVKIRLRRMGKKKQPSYRVVVADSRMPRDGRYIESLGYYDPKTEPSVIEINEERALYWLGEGAQPSGQVQNLLKIKGIWEQFASGKAKQAPVEKDAGSTETDTSESTESTE